MGASFQTRTFRHDDRAKIKTSWKEMVSEADHEDGHSPYNGSINQLGSEITRWHDLRLASEDAAAEKLDSMVEKRDPAIAVSFLVARKETPAEQKRVAKLEEKLSEAKAVTKAAREGALAAVQASGAKDTAAYRPFIVCSGCKSKLAREPFFAHRRDRLLSCPVCEARWGLAAKRDAARIVKALAKEEAAQAAVTAARAPKPSTSVGWVVGGLAGE